MTEEPRRRETVPRPAPRHGRRGSRAELDPRVVVATLTFRRSSDLRRLLDSLADSVEEAHPLCRAITVLIVDNDSERSSEHVVDEARRRTTQYEGVTLAYLHVPSPGISTARNAAIDFAADQDLLVFVDDDCVTSSGWLVHLITTHRRFRRAAVAGRVVPSYEHEPTEWNRAQEAFARPSMPTGTIREWAATNNLLLDVGSMRAAGLRFAEELSLIGGEDTLFTRQLTGAGETLVWCEEALVHEVVPATRMERSWVLRRRFRVGASGVLVCLLATPSVGQVRVRGEHALAGIWEAASGAANWVVAWASRSEWRRSRAEGRVAGGLGRLTGAAGWQYYEYERSGRRRLRRAPGRRARADAL